MLPLLFLGYAYGVAFFAPSAYSPLISILRLLALWILAAGPHLWWSLCVCVGFFLRRRSCVFFLSSCSVWGRLLLSLFWCGFCASSWGACGFPRRVLPLVALSGQPAPVSWPTPAVETCCWVGVVFGAPLGFLPCAVLFLRGLRFAQLPLPQLTLGGFSAFSVTGCRTYCYSGGVGWAATLPLYFCASPAPAGLQGFAGFCTLCQGAPVGVVSALWATV